MKNASLNLGSQYLFEMLLSVPWGAHHTSNGIGSWEGLILGGLSSSDSRGACSQLWACVYWLGSTTEALLPQGSQDGPLGPRAPCPAQLQCLELQSM